MARGLTPEQMVMPKAIAPFEAAECFARWHDLMIAEARSQNTTLDQAATEGDLVVVRDVCGGLGPPWPLLGERPSDFGERCAVALFTLIKEI